MERHTRYDDIFAVGLILAVPIALVLIQSQIRPEFYSWIQFLPQYQKCLIAPFVAFGWQYLVSNLIGYTALISALLLMVGKKGIPRISRHLALCLVLVPVITAIIHTATGQTCTSLGFSGVVFAIAGGICSWYLIADLNSRARCPSLAAFVAIMLSITLLLEPAVIPLVGGGYFYSDALGHAIGYIVGFLPGLYLRPIPPITHRWFGLIVLVLIAW